MDILLASTNEGKRKEICTLLGNEFKILNLKDIGYTDIIEETGNTFYENAMIKCRALADKHSLAVIADDSGLVVPALKGEPGIYSARYGGEGLDDRQRCQHLLSKLAAVQGNERKAYFVCNLIYYESALVYTSIQEICAGMIQSEMKGDNGFGYDPVFFLPEFNQTMAELELEQKNKISHRGKALQKLKRLLINE